MKGLDGFHFVRRCVLDACNGDGQSFCGINDYLLVAIISGTGMV